MARRAYTIVATNYKGGNGKSTVLSAAAAECAIRGFRVGIMDVDSQPSNIAYFLGVPREDNLFRALIGDQVGDGKDARFIPVPLNHLVREVPYDSWYAPVVDIDSETDTLVPLAAQPPVGKLFILPSGDNTFRIPGLLPDAELVDDLIDEFVDEYQLDFLFIDTPGAPSHWNALIYRNSDAFIYVTEAETASLAGLVEVSGQVERFSRRRVRKGLPPIKLLGIVPNKVRLKAHYDNLRDLGVAYEGLVAPPLRLLRTYAKIIDYGQTIRAYAPNSPEAFEMYRAVEFLFAQVPT